MIYEVKSNGVTIEWTKDREKAMECFITSPAHEAELFAIGYTGTKERIAYRMTKAQKAEQKSKETYNV